MPTHSIVIPVYNAERFLKEHRTYCKDDDFEYILVDDGSTDRSPEICDEIATENKNVVVIHQKNQGAAAARNKGLSIARGKWICFFDIDDKWDNTAFQLIKKITKYGLSDLYVTAFSVKTQNEIEHIKIKNAIYQRNEFGEYVAKEVIAKQHGNGFLWNKIYRREIALQIWFNTDYSVMEDEIFNQSYLLHCTQIECLSLSYYTYIIDNPNNSREKFIDNYYRIIEQVDDGFVNLINVFPIKNDILKKKFHDALFSRRHRGISRSITYYMFHPDSHMSNKQRKEMLKYISFSNIFKECFHDNKIGQIETRLYYWCIEHESLLLLSIIYEIFVLLRKLNNAIS